jgi:hypothetical protein
MPGPGSMLGYQSENSDRNCASLGLQTGIAQSENPTAMPVTYQALLRRRVLLIRGGGELRRLTPRIRTASEGRPLCR